jgi:hypothetical protein
MSFILKVFLKQMYNYFYSLQTIFIVFLKETGHAYLFNILLKLLGFCYFSAFNLLSCRDCTR